MWYLSKETGCQHEPLITLLCFNDFLVFVTTGVFERRRKREKNIIRGCVRVFAAHMYIAYLTTAHVLRGSGQLGSFVSFPFHSPMFTDLSVLTHIPHCLIKGNTSSYTTTLLECTQTKVYCMYAHTYTLTHTHTKTHCFLFTLSRSHRRPPSLAHRHTHTPSLPRTQTHTHPLPPLHTDTHTRPPSLAHRHTHTLWRRYHPTPACLIVYLILCPSQGSAVGLHPCLVCILMK